jgi:hypothetical protein
MPQGALQALGDLAMGGVQRGVGLVYPIPLEGI